MVSDIYPFSDNKFIGRNSYRGEAASTPIMAVLDGDFNLISDVKNRHLGSYGISHNYCSLYGDNILYWEILNDTIFSLEEWSMVPRYFVDFQQYAIPQSVRKDNETPLELSEWMTSSDSKLATGINCVCEDESNVVFVFVFREDAEDGAIHYAKYDKKSRESSAFRFHDSQGHYESTYFMKYHEGSVVLALHDDKDTESNPVLLFVRH